MSQKIRVGVVGAGFARLVHIPAFQLNPDTEVVAVCSGHRSNAEQTARDFGIPRVHDDYRSLVADPDVDAVAVVTPPVYHCEMTLAALRAGKHVLCEKPTAMNAGEAQQMLQAAQATGLTAMIAHEFRFSSQRAWARALIQDGYLGKPTAVHIRMFTEPFLVPRPWGWLADEKMGGGYLFALGSHFVDAIRDWCGEFASVSGRLAVLYPDRVKPDGSIAGATADDAFFIHGLLGNGALVSIAASTGIQVGGGVAIELYGSEGTLVLDQGRFLNPQPDSIVIGARAGEKALAHLPAPPMYAPPQAGSDHRLPPFTQLVERFVRSIRTGERLSPDLVDGLRNQRVLDAVRQSSREGRWVTIPSE